MITIKSNDKVVAARYASASSSVNTEFHAAMDDMGRFTVKLLQRKVPVKTGKLKESLGYKLEKTETGYKLTFSATAIAESDGAYYGHYVDQGTRPHKIVPKNATALHFFDKSGNERFAKMVYHPGAKASKFTNKSKPEAMQHAQVVLKQIARRVHREVKG